MTGRKSFASSAEITSPVTAIDCGLRIGQTTLKLREEIREGIEISPSASPSLPESSQGQRVRRKDSRDPGRRRAGPASSSLLRVSQSAPVVSSLLPPSTYRPIEPLL